MVKTVRMLSDNLLDKSVLRDATSSLGVVQTEIDKVKNILEELSKPVVHGKTPNMDIRKEGAVGVLKMDLLTLQVALKKADTQISLGIRTLNRSLR